MSEDRMALAQALCARLCHDLGGPVGSLAAMMELGPEGGAEAEELARDSVETLRRRIQLFRLLAGASGDLSPAGLAECLDGQLAHGRVKLDVGALDTRATIPAAAVPAVLTGIMLAAEALPRGGRVVLAGDPSALLITPDGRNAAWQKTLVAMLSRDGTDTALTPRTVLVHCLVAAGDAAGIALRLAPGPTGTALLLTRKC